MEKEKLIAEFRKFYPTTPKFFKDFFESLDEGEGIYMEMLFHDFAKQVKNNGVLDDVSKKLFCGNCDKFSTCKSVVNFDSPACGIYSEEK